MDNKKIGKLIADLRKHQGLTQQELGDKVGVGFRSVSKWERGITLPDITIINELSQILGISSDELLTGELNKDSKPINKNKLTKYIKVIIPIITLVIGIFIILYSHNKTYAYNLRSISDEYYVEGQVVFRGNKISIVINKLDFLDEEFSNTIVTNYEYKISTCNKFLFAYGYNTAAEQLETETDINYVTQNININYNDITKIKREDILNNNIFLTMIFITKDNKVVTEQVELLLYPSPEAENK